MITLWRRNGGREREREKEMFGLCPLTKEEGKGRGVFS